MSYIDELLAAYARFVALPWQENLAPPQRVWMAVYPPEHERRLQRYLTAFQTATIQAKHTWHETDITTAFLSKTQDADLPQALTDLSAQQTALQAALRGGASLIQQSLMDFLR